MTDGFGNYVVQVMVDNATDEQLATIVPLLEGQMIHLSEDKKSNYVIQKIIQMACKIVSTTNQMDIKDRLLTFMRNTVDALSPRVKDLCCHQSATRIIQCVLKNFPESFQNSILRALSRCFDDIVKNIYGTYVLQDAVKLQNHEFLEAARVSVESRFLDISMDQFGSLFLEHYLETSRFRDSAINKMLSGYPQDAILIRMLNNSSAHYVLKKLVDLSDEEQLKVLNRFTDDHRELVGKQGFGSDFMTVLREKVSKLTASQGFVARGTFDDRPTTRGRSRSRSRSNGRREKAFDYYEGGSQKRRRSLSRSPSPAARHPQASYYPEYGNSHSADYYDYERGKPAARRSPSPQFGGREKERGRDWSDNRVPLSEEKRRPLEEKGRAGAPGSSGKLSAEEKDVLGRVDTLARTQHGSRLVQNAISNGTKEMRQQIFDEMRSTLVSLMTDVFGNYVVQVMVDNATDEQLATIVPLLEGQMINLSEDKKSNYVIQKIIQMACKIVSTTNQMDIKDRLLTFMRNTVDALCSKLKELSCHQSGCRIVQCCIKHFDAGATKDRLLRGLIDRFEDLCRNIYGTYVLQELLKAGEEKFNNDIIDVFEKRILELSKDQYGSLLVEQFLEPTRNRDMAITRILNGHPDECIVIKMANHNIASKVLKKLLELSDEEQLKVLDRFTEDHRELMAKQGFGSDFMSVVREKVNKFTGGRGFVSRDNFEDNPRGRSRSESNGKQVEDYYEGGLASGSQKRRRSLSRSPSPAARRGQSSYYSEYENDGNRNYYDQDVGRQNNRLVFGLFFAF
jgi:hypothetical protein